MTFEESKLIFVEALIDSAVLIIETIWGENKLNQTTRFRNMPLRRFIQETLKRSRSSYSTFQVALYYLILIKPLIKDGHYQPDVKNCLNCGRRTLLTSLMLAAKYLQDRNYSVGAWSKISGLCIKELSNNEINFLKAVDWNLHIPSQVYIRWSSLLLASATEDSQVWVDKIKSISSDISTYSSSFDIAATTPTTSEVQDEDLEFGDYLELPVQLPTPVSSPESQCKRSREEDEDEDEDEVVMNKRPHK